MRDVLQLAYISDASVPFTQEALEKLLIGARSNNARLNVTGALIFNSGSFFQVLEGPEPVVRALFAKVSSDVRHVKVSIVLDTLASERAFPNWSMAYRSWSTIDVWLRDKIENMIGQLSRDETLYNIDQAKELLDALSEAV